MWTDAPFALFDLEGESPELLNHILQSAHDGSTVDNWWLYLATADYAAAPQKRWPKAQGTSAPISPDFRSPWIGQSVPDVAKWLKKKPENVDLDVRHFVILDKKAKTEGKVVLCRRGDAHLKGDELSCLLWEAATCTLFWGGLRAYDWDDQLERHRYYPDVGSGE